ncbi:MAG: hypothetical protein MK179_12455 [Pirellulaceae bacterium]|nr:hypothetical protein [Pirellulaceae bacterium]
METESGHPESLYRQRAARYQQQEDKFRVQDKSLGYVRGLVFLLAAGFLFVGLSVETGQAVYYSLCAISVIAFVSLVIFHDHVSHQLSRNQELRKMNEQALARSARRWGEFPASAIPIPERHQAVANDLDLFGHASIYHLLNQTGTPRGMETLRDWLLDPAHPSEVVARQEAVGELAPLVELREELHLRGRMLMSSFAGPEPFIAWAEGPGWLQQRPWWKWFARGMPLLILTLIVLTASQRLPADTGTIAILLCLVTNLLVSAAICGNVHDVFDRVSSKDGEVKHYGALFELLYGLPVTATKLQAIERDTTKNVGGVLRGFRALGSIMVLAAARHSALAFILIYIPAQLLVLWDFHVLTLLERWQHKYRSHVRLWFDALGEFEALASLATLKHDNPHWVFATIDKQANSLSAQSLGHPLLTDSERVRNDVRVGPANSFLLVTGSNMSGKSTLLRCLGVNAMLAQAGSVVCAQQLTLPPVTITTSMRIQDSLEEGVSFYLAELQRLKHIVTQSGEFQDQTDRRLVYLLDEILLGTNSQERHIAIVHVLGHLIANGAWGAISTHDLDLATSEPIADCCQVVHFRESFDDGQMTFDYLMRPGIATTTNALKLMEMVGLDPPKES